MVPALLNTTPEYSYIVKKTMKTFVYLLESAVLEAMENNDSNIISINATIQNKGCVTSRQRVKQIDR